MKNQNQQKIIDQFKADYADEFKNPNATIDGLIELVLYSVNNNEIFIERPGMFPANIHSKVLRLSELLKLAQ